MIFKFRGPFSRSGKKTRRIGKGYAILAQPKWIPIFGLIYTMNAKNLLRSIFTTLKFCRKNMNLTRPMTPPPSFGTLQFYVIAMTHNSHDATPSFGKFQFYVISDHDFPCIVGLLIQGKFSCFPAKFFSLL